MSSQPTAHSIAGGWLGTYYYNNTFQQPMRFEATFSLVGHEGAFGGRIMDDGVLGEAKVTDGMQVVREVAFSKVYIRPPASHNTAPIHYEGTMSEDGKLLTGTWLVRMTGHSKRTQTLRGTWEARRLWTEVMDEVAAEESEERTLVTVGGR